MKHIPKLHYDLFICICLAAITILSEVSWASDTVTVITYSQKYENVAYKYKPGASSLEIFPQGDKVEIPLSEIRFIFDRDGNDITKSIFGETSSPSKEAPKIGDLNDNSAAMLDSDKGGLFAVRSKPAKLPWNFAVRLGPAYWFPVGDYYKGIKSGTGYEADLHIGNNKQTVVRLSVSGVTLPTGDEFKWYSTDPDIVILKQKTEFKAMRYRVGLESFDFFNKNRSELNMYHGYFGCGIIKQRIETHVTARNDSTGETGELYGKVSESKFELTGGVGCLIGIGKKAAIDLSVEYDMIFLGEDNAKAYIFGVKTGLFIPLKISM